MRAPLMDGEIRTKSLLLLMCFSWTALLIPHRFALGDSRRPLHETAALVEDIVHTQLINMVRLTTDPLTRITTTQTSEQ